MVDRVHQRCDRAHVLGPPRGQSQRFDERWRRTCDIAAAEPSRKQRSVDGPRAGRAKDRRPEAGHGHQ